MLFFYFRLGYNPHERAIPVRMYCDICEEFDLHETEDCPQQASDEPMVGSQVVGLTPAKEKPPPRPYCDICEGKFIIIHIQICFA